MPVIPVTGEGEAGESLEPWEVEVAESRDHATALKGPGLMGPEAYMVWERKGETSSRKKTARRGGSRL